VAFISDGDPLAHARHRGWIEFGSSILSDLLGFETAKYATTYEATPGADRQVWPRRSRTGDGPFFAGEAFSLVDAVFAPIFRYFDVFDTIAPTGVFDALHRVTAWRKALAQRPSVGEAITDDYADRLKGFPKEP
jgi:glutathione S-transferase